MNHLSEQDLILLYYGEPDEAEGARLHLQQCPQCAFEARALRETLERMDALEVPEPRVGLEKELWGKLAPEVPRSKREGTVWPWNRNWKWVPALGLALVAIVVINRPQLNVPAGLSDSSRQRILAMSLADHLDRTQMLLTELENVPDTVPGDLEPLRLRAQDLVEESRLMRQWLKKGQQDGALAVVDEADRVLTEAANAAGGPEELKVLRERIGADSLLFRVRVIEANLRMEGQKS